VAVHHIAYISVGSNLGDKLANCRRGIAALTQPEVSTLKGQSLFYRTAPVDYEDQDWFINGVAKIETTLDPEQLLRQLKQIETDTGRADTVVRFGPRVLDLDILLFDDAVIDTELLVIPHPRMHKRRFVLQPFCDIDPTKLHPVCKKTIRALLDRLRDAGQVVMEYT